MNVRHECSADHFFPTSAVTEHIVSVLLLHKVNERCSGAPSMSQCEECLHS